MRSPSPAPETSPTLPSMPGSMPGSAPAPLTGTVLARRYELRALIGRGGMGEVYEAADPVLDRTVAVKVLRPELAADRRSGARFEREARTAARLSHPGIVAVFDAGRHEERVYIVMEHVAGSTLVEALRRHRGPLGSSAAAAIGADVAEALAHAHDRGVVHRDVTPGNVMLGRDGRAKVLDFGIARAAQGSIATSSMPVHGTLAYVAPEVLSGSAGDQLVDVYGLGAVLYELLTGVPPFRGGADDLERRLRVRRPVPLRGWAPDVPEELDALVRRLLSFEPGDRPENLAPVARSLRELAASPSTRPTAPLLSASASSSAGVSTVAAAPPLTPVLVPPTRRLDAERDGREGAPGRNDASARPRSTRRRWQSRVGHIAAWLALLAVCAGAGAIVVPSVFAAAEPVSASVVPPPQLPAPSELAVVASCDGWLSTGVDLTWTPVAGASNYEIWRRGTADDDFELVETVGAGVNAVRDIDLGIDTSYAYRVRGLDDQAVGAWSVERVAETPLLCLT